MRAYAVQLVIEVAFFYVFYNLMETQKIAWYTRLIGLAFVPLISVLEALLDFSVYLIFILILCLLNYHFQVNLAGINLLLFSFLSRIIVSLVTNVLTIPFVNQNVEQGWPFIIRNLTSDGTLLLIAWIGLKKPINRLFHQRDFGYVLIFLQASLLIILYSFIQLLHELDLYDQFTIGTLAFTSAELLLLCSLFWLAYIRTKRHYQAKIEQQELNNLTAYTEQLEQSQLELRKFRHDYKNMLLSVSELAQSEDLSAVNTYLDDLKSYSNQALNEATDRYQDIDNVQEIHMKSVLLSKFFTMMQKKIDYQFECRVPIKTLTINPFDMVRLLSITLDNAIEGVRDAKSKKIKVIMLQTAETLQLTVTNTHVATVDDFNQLSQPGVTTKAQHTGLGLAIIADLRRKYPQLLVSQQTTQDLVTVQLVITT